mmetsp:Transcript_8515/g.24425  ORF Transcript_8515/g.24425 Transcript_8515/m.24425 type:complete len:233 (-) Transcript_8515:51-749(-)
MAPLLCNVPTWPCGSSRCGCDEILGLGDGDTHVPGCSLNNLHGGLHSRGIQVWHLDLSDFLELCLCDCGDLRGSGPAITLGDTGSLLDKLRGRRRLQNEREAAILVHRDLAGNNGSGLVLSGGVVLLAEGHDVHTSSTESGTDGWGRVGLSGWQGNLDNLCYFRCHCGDTPDALASWGLPPGGEQRCARAVLADAATHEAAAEGNARGHGGPGRHCRRRHHGSGHCKVPWDC